MQTLIAQAPQLIDDLSPEDQAHLNTLKQHLDRLAIPYTLNPHLVRGLDYYEHTVWEVAYEGIGAQNSIAGGGRYQITPPGFNALNMAPADVRVAKILVPIRMRF